MAFKSIIGATCACLAIVSFNVNSALLERLGGLAYYDDEADLTRLADANHAQTSGYDADGMMTWQESMDWVVGSNVGGVDGWRLADTLQPDASCSSQSGSVSYDYNCTGSEMGNLYYNALSNTAGSITNTDPFSNVQPDFYWSATEYAPNTNAAWYFFMSNGRQGNASKGSSFYAWAVHSGDVSAVPVPSAVWLFGSGLIGLIGLARSKA